MQDHCRLFCPKKYVGGRHFIKQVQEKQTRKRFSGGSEYPWSLRGKMTYFSGSKVFGCFEKHPKVVSGALRGGFRAREVFGSFEKRTPGKEEVLTYHVTYRSPQVWNAVAFKIPLWYSAAKGAEIGKYKLELPFICRLWMAVHLSYRGLRIIGDSLFASLRIVPWCRLTHGCPGVRFSKDPKTSRARRLFGALFGWISRVPESVSQRARKHPGFSPEFFGLFSRVCSASLTVIC